MWKRSVEFRNILAWTLTAMTAFVQTIVWSVANSKIHPILYYVYLKVYRNPLTQQHQSVLSPTLK